MVVGTTTVLVVVDKACPDLIGLHTPISSHRHDRSTEGRMEMVHKNKVTESPCFRE